MTTRIGNQKDDKVIAETSGKLMGAGRWQVFGNYSGSGTRIGLIPERVSHDFGTRIGLGPQRVSHDSDGTIIGMLRSRVSKWIGR